MSSPDEPGAPAAEARAAEVPAAGAPGGGAAGGPPALPVISVRKGRATPAELAAVLTVLAAISAQATAPAAEPAPAALWAERSREWFTLPRPGPRSWRASALPR